ncbi:metallophosphoesterase [Dialister sp.]|uniref:metallophosphoesterase n=1 Tax=Dialister sp. TaxID=1955814 RepID=UPI003F0FCCC8
MMFERMILMIFSFLGILNGIFGAIIFRRRRFYFYLAGSWLLSFLSAGYFLWYARGYDGLGLWSLWLGYLACGLMVAEIIALPCLFFLALLSIPRKLQKGTRALTLAVLFLAAGIGVYGAIDGNTSEKVEHLDVYVDGLPAAFDGYRAAQMTDTHIGPYFRYGDLPGEIERARQEGAQVLLFTGDLIDDIRHMPEAAHTLAEKQGEFPDGIIYVWGNHEYYRGKDYIESELVKTPVKLLVNEHTAITRGGSSIYVAGVDYPWARGDAMKKEMDDMTEEAWQGIPQGAPVIFLAHHSAFIDEGFRKGAAVTLTGHTHGTQFGLFGRPIITPFTYTRGLYSDGRTVGYVSRGDASWFPFRFSCPRELVIITLHRKQPA